VRGVGQSSWGPTVFALVENDVAARQLGERLGSLLAPDETWQIARPTSRGADLQVTNSL
jgi:predicted sugar kinase